MGNPKAFEGKREATQFKAGGEEPLIAKIDLKLTETMKQELKAIPGWQGKLRDAIAELIKAESQAN
ncbi:hypothetical protein [Brasilonema octagenarum]|uniref:Uncharacterized protein n=1 Tax=Brasilonema octagenarum UFV-OR1 TaxID=417115 RepID=A0ABX1ML31_9CYAN|nr:hypothetical protein [Brasilonema octagenarum]NMF67434.1 hypothetical protein [Brasilonema octagenarum UFV-OR1]